MNFKSQLILFVLIFSAILSLYTSFLLFKRRKAPGAIYFTANAIACFIWVVGYLIEFLGSDIETKMWGVRIQYFFGIPFVCTLWFAAALHYNSHGTKPKPVMLILLNVIPFATMILMWTNDSHHLVYRSAGIITADGLRLITKQIGSWYYVNVVYSYAALLAGTILLLYSFKKSRSIYRGQIIIFVIASLLPWISNFLYVVGMNSFMRLDITPIAFTITMILVWLGLFRYQLFDIVPAARNLVIESMQNGLIVLDYHDRVIDANPFAQKIFKSENLIGISKDELFKGVKFNWTIDESKLTEIYEVDIRNATYEMIISDIPDRFKNPSGKVITLYDITERKKTEKKLQDLNSSKDKLFSIIAHDLKNPFFGMIGLSEILREDFKEIDDSEKMRLINDLNDLSLNTFKMLENLLDWSRQQTGRLVFAPLNFSLIELVNRNLQMAQQQAAIKNINIKSNMPESMDVFADSNMIDTVVRNLISNAIKFTESGGQIEVAVFERNGNAFFSVKDNGVGMDEEKLKKLFLLNSDTKSNGTAGEHGTGLGLLLCKEFIEKNGGIITVESEPGKGSTFTSSIPRTK